MASHTGKVQGGPPEGLKDHLDALHDRYNHPEYISPDPLELVRPYADPADREVAALVASSLAFGNVRQILGSVGVVLDCLPEPARCVQEWDRGKLRRVFRCFRHRYVGGVELADMLHGAGRLIAGYGSLGECFADGDDRREPTVRAALERFVTRLRAASGGRSYLVPSPEDGSACKRLNLFLRWMVRRDAVDPGGWRVSTERLIVPLDTHMHRLARALGLTRRAAADLKTALEVTEAFRRMAPEDPVRYDFALTRLGIRTDTDMEAFLRLCRADDMTWISKGLQRAVPVDIPVQHKVRST